MQFIQQMVNGISVGSVYALIALGYTMVYGIVKLINFAHGDILMIGGITGFFVITALGGATPLSLILAFIISMILCAVFGIVIEKTCYKPLRKAPRINALITAIGVSILLENGARVIPFIGPTPRMFPTMANFNKQVIPGVSRIQIIMLFVSVAFMLLLTYIINFTKMGKAMRATSFDMNAAMLMGIDVNKVISFTFAIGAALAAAAGILFASAYPQVEPYMGIMPGLKAFVAAVLGGIGSVPGAVLGGFIIGIAETLTKGYISSQLADAIVFGILILILVVKPTGLLGKNIKEKV